MSQFVGFWNFIRLDAGSALMKPALANLSDADLTSVVAYAASLDP